MGIKGWGMVGISAASGGVGAAIAGGKAEDILFGVVSGAMVGMFNHKAGEIAQKRIEKQAARQGGNNFADYVELAGDIGGPIGSGAKNILDNRGAYMPRGQIYRMNKPVTVRILVVNINTTSKVLNYTRLGGKVLVVGGVVATGYQVGSDISNGDYYSAGARAAVFGVAAGAAFIPVVGWGVAIGIGVADYVWGDQFYNYVETRMGD